MSNLGQESKRWRSEDFNLVSAEVELSECYDLKVCTAARFGRVVQLFTNKVCKMNEKNNNA